MPITPAAEDFLQRLADELEVPESRYESAKRSYMAVSKWLDRDESPLKAYDPVVYVQGSFRLGTAIKPINDEEHYDIDLVCELQSNKSRFSQKELKALFGREIAGYAAAYSMQEPSEGRRCWTLNYADEAQFHLDALPALPDGESKRLLLEHAHLSTEWSQYAIAITDRDHPDFTRISRTWPHSNPKGYTEWFRSRMRKVFQARREGMALEAKASVEDIPSYRVKTPLQQAVQILKRHRDILFADRPDDKPISIILTTLSGQSYNNEATVAHAIDVILENMHRFIEFRDDGLWIPNPTDPLENFADRWRKHPERRDAFYRWLGVARQQFTALFQEPKFDRIASAMSTAFGQRTVSAIQASKPRATVLQRVFGAASSPLFAKHRQTPQWPEYKQHTVRIVRAVASRNGYRDQVFASNSAPLPKGMDLRFKAETNTPEPFNVFWQVVNTGQEAEAANGLRGNFAAGSVYRGKVEQKESTSYTGSHSIECFIVKNGLLVARSGAFIVNIR